jgi:hypothetical protein
MPLHIPTTSEAANDDQRSSQHFDSQSPTMQRMLMKFRTPLANSTPGTPRAASLSPHVPVCNTTCTSWARQLTTR